MFYAVSFTQLEGRLAFGNVTAVFLVLVLFFTSERIHQTILAPLTRSWIWREASLPLCTMLIQMILQRRPSFTVFCHTQSFTLK